jgi:signal transduction histidine kinase
MNGPAAELTRELTATIGHARILVVDDEPSARRGLELLLRDEGFTVACASNGADALEEVARFRPDVVITDLRMPVLNGLDLCARLHERCPELPIIITTAYGEMQSVVLGLRAGASDYLTKPLEFDAVLLSVRRAIEKRAAHTEREHLRRHAEALYEEAMSAVQRRDEVLSIVSHDLRNPLSVIHVNAQVLSMEAKEHEYTLKDLAESTLRATTSMGRLLDDLVDEARLGGAGLRLDRQRHQVGDLLEDASELRPLALQRGVRLELHAPRADDTVDCDRARMGRVLANLITNAIKFSSRGGTITVGAESAIGEIRFFVRDAGPGIKAEALPHLFERFWQAPGGNRPGAGLGLFIAKGIVDAHKGRISVESQEGAGSTFTVSLPIGEPS